MGGVEPAIVELNLIKRSLEEVKCAACSRVGGGQKVYCGLCGKVVHKLCTESRLRKEYWYCGDCTPGLDEGDPAQDLALQALVLGGPPPPAWSQEQVAALRERYVVRRGHLVDCVGG